MYFLSSSSHVKHCGGRLHKATVQGVLPIAEECLACSRQESPGHIVHD